MNFRNLPICHNCYWFTGYDCEIYFDKPVQKRCPNFLNDREHSKRVKWWLMFEPETAKRNWNLLDDIDRRKFINMYGKPEKELPECKISIYCKYNEG